MSVDNRKVLSKAVQDVWLLTPQVTNRFELRCKVHADKIILCHILALLASDRQIQIDCFHFLHYHSLNSNNIIQMDNDRNIR